MSPIIFILISSSQQARNLYLDPGSGSFLLQLIIASALGAIFVIKASWGKIKSFTFRLFSKPDESEDTGLEDDQ